MHWDTIGAPARHQLAKRAFCVGAWYGAIMRGTMTREHMQALIDTPQVQRAMASLSGYAPLLYVDDFDDGANLVFEIHVPSEPTPRQALRWHLSRFSQGPQGLQTISAESLAMLYVTGPATARLTELGVAA